MRMEQIKYFLEVAATGSITSAAQQLFISQQALSETLKKLEKELGLVLFIRSKTGVVLTEDGHLFATHAAEIFKHYQEFEQAVAKKYTPDGSVISGSVTVYTTPLLANTLLADIIELLHKTYPSIRVQCIETNAQDMVESLCQRKSHLGLLSLGVSAATVFFKSLPKSLCHRELFPDEITACISKNSPLAMKDHISIEEFKAQTRIGFKYIKELMPQDMGNDKILAFSNNTALHEKFVIQNLAVSAVPELLYAKIFSSPLMRPLSIRPSIEIGHYLLLPQGHESEEMTAFLTVLFKYIEELTPNKTLLN